MCGFMFTQLSNLFSFLPLQNLPDNLPAGQLPHPTASNKEVSTKKLSEQEKIFETLQTLSTELSSYEPKKIALQLINDRNLNSDKKSRVTKLIKELVELRIHCK